MNYHGIMDQCLSRRARGTRLCLRRAFQADDARSGRTVRQWCAHFISEVDEGQAEAINNGLLLTIGKLLLGRTPMAFMNPAR
jgi:hypothetical protein